jgi:hypothetical protein
MLFLVFNRFVKLKNRNIIACHLLFSAIFCPFNTFSGNLHLKFHRLMKTRYTLFLFLFSGLCASAQITLGTTDMPVVNDSLKVSINTTIGTLNATLTDTNYVWDFTTLVPARQDVEHFDNPLNFALPFNLLFNPFNTSYGLYNYTPDSIPGTPIKLSKSYDFIKNSSADYKTIGKGLFLNGIPVNAQYTKDDYVYRFPMMYGNTDSCDYKYGASVPTQFYYGEKGHRVNTVDGWGTLKVPMGTFQVLRIKSVLNMTDTIYLDTIHFGFNRPLPKTIQYKWMSAGGKIPVLEIDGTVAGGVFTPNSVTYRDTMRHGVPQTGIAEVYAQPLRIATWPNPGTGSVYFDLNGLKASEIKVFDASGKMISAFRVGSEIPMLDVNAYPQGIYFFQVISHDQQVLGRGKIAVIH